METQAKHSFVNGFAHAKNTVKTMLNTYGLKRKKAMLIKMAEPSDPQVNAIIQAAVTALNQLIADRRPGGA